MLPRPKRLSFSAALVVTCALAPSAAAQTSGANATHDPSRIIESDGAFYFCSTGGSCASSANGLSWSTTGLRLSIPSWATTYTPNNQGVWAPDIVFYNGQFYIYYSFCGVGVGSPCVIGLYTTPTLDSKSGRFKLADAGMVVKNPANDATYQFSTIDPGPIIDPAGNLWSSWGSGYGKDQAKTQLWLTRLGTNGLPLATDPAYLPPTVLGYPLETGRREGSYVYYRTGSYYLLWNEGSCCDGTASTYTIWMARSQGSISGPYSGTRVFYAGGGNIHGPGHMGIYDSCGVQRFTYHYYPTANSVLGENDLSWGADGWPVAGPVSTAPLVPCGANSSGDDAGITGATFPADGGAADGGGGRGGAGQLTTDAAADATGSGDSGDASSIGPSHGGEVGIGADGGASSNNGAAADASHAGGGSLDAGSVSSGGGAAEATGAMPAAGGCSCRLSTDSSWGGRWALPLLLGVAGALRRGARGFRARASRGDRFRLLTGFASTRWRRIAGVRPQGSTSEGQTET